MYQNLTDNILGRNSNAFSVDMLKKLFKGEKILYSPVNYYTGLIMLLIGCDENSESQLMKILHIENINDKLVENHNELQKIINYTDDKENLIVKSINKFFVDNGYIPCDELVEKIEKFGKLQEGNFCEIEKEMSNINKFMKTETNDLFSDILDNIEIQKLNRGINVSCMYLKASWVNRFEIEKTEQREFINLAGDKKMVNYMTQIEYFPYMENENVQILRLNVCSQLYSLLFVLPKNDTSFLMPTLEDYEKYCTSCLYKSVKVSIPKFNHVMKQSMYDDFHKLGLVQIFKNDGVKKYLKIDDMIGSISFTINENGIGDAVAENSEIFDFERNIQADFNANKPFSYFLMHNETGVILIAGVYNE